MIQRIIIKDINGITVLNNHLKEMCQREDIEREFIKAGLPILSINVDTVGVALVQVARRMMRF